MSTSEPDTSPYPNPGEVIDGKYRCERVLGIGGMGAVIHATHLLRKAPVALKFMNPGITTEPSAVERFLNEAIAASRIESEHVVKIFDVNQLPNGTPYLVMEYLAGLDLSQILTREGNPGIHSLPRTVHFVLQILRGLQVAHDAGIVHRDMKPSNCFVIDKDGEPDFVKLLDFGISKVQQADGVSLTRTNSLLGTPLYMAPEQARSAKYADARTDLYATGVILYELLSGRPPFNTETGEFTDLLLNIFSADAPPLRLLRPDLPEAFCSVAHKCFARDSSDRFQTAHDMIEGLAPWADERSRTVIEGARRRAAREAPASAVVPVKAPPLKNMPSAVAPKVTADSARPPPASALAAGAENQDSGLAASLARPASPTVVRKRSGLVLILGAGLLLTGLAIGLALWDSKEAPPAEAPGGVVASADTSLVASPASAPAAPVSTAALVVVEPPAPPSAPPPPSSARVPGPTTASPPPATKPDAGKPRLGDITIHQ